MKPILENINYNRETSFKIKQDILPYIKVPFHFHPEYELVYILEGKGTRFIGDSIEDFEKGDLVLLGSNLPHAWKNNKTHYQNNLNIRANVIVFHFSAEVFEKIFFSLSEMKFIKELLNNSKYGIKITGSSNIRIGGKMINAIKLSSAKKFIQLLDILDDICQNPSDYRYLSKKNYTEIASGKHSQRLIRVFEYIANNFENKISLQQIAKIAHMNPSAFCRYFKQLTGKSFSEYLNEIRINYAKKLLASKQQYVTSIAYQSGFNSLSYFNKQFKKKEGMTPLEYGKLYINGNESL